LGTTPDLWMNMQSQYDLWRAREGKLKNNTLSFFLTKNRELAIFTLDGRLRAIRLVL
jgi:plasmid maintenance system antidote protein VapI